jgi:carbamoyl-phosphate synthase large subunit
LVEAFRAAAKKLEIRLEIHGADTSGMSPAIHCVDRAHRVLRIDDPKYIDALVRIVDSAEIDAIIPLLDPELPVLAGAADTFNKIGCQPIVGSPTAIRTCQDKLFTYKTLRTAKIDTPRTWPWKELLEQPKHRFPYFLKPQRGSAGVGNYIIHNAAELSMLGRRVDDPIVQELIEGDEYTVDVYCGLDGQPRCAVPRKRLEVRNGEVSKGLIVKDSEIMGIAMGVANVLVGSRGVITVQCIATKPRGRGRSRKVKVIEINPRFGGGVPLSIHAGADFPKWILMELLGRKPRINEGCFKDDVLMLRYDEAVYVKNGSELIE